MNDAPDELFQKRVTLRFLPGLDDPAIALVRQCRQPAVLSERLSRLVSLGLEYQSLKQQGLVHAVSPAQETRNAGDSQAPVPRHAGRPDREDQEVDAASDEQAAFFLVAAGGLGASA